MKRSIFLPGLLALLLPAVLQAQAQPQPAPQDLLQIYALARAADPQLAGAGALRGVQQQNTVQARAALLPQWSLELSGSRLPGGAHQQQLDSRISQVLLDLSRLREWDAQQSLLSAEEAQLQAAEQALCARVARAYFGVLSAEAAVRNARANEAAFARQVEQASTRFAAGLSAALDVEQARAYHQLSRGSSLQEQEALQDAREALAEIIGQEPGPLLSLAAELRPQAPQPQQRAVWAERALQQNPALRAETLRLQASEQRLRSAGAAHLPTLSLNLDSQRRQGSAVAAALQDRNDHTLTLRLNIPLFAGGATESQKQRAVHQRDAQREQLEAARRALLRETQAQYQAVLSSLQLLESTAAAVRAANEALAATRAGQALGTRSMTDLLLAIQTQTAAQGAHEQARHRHVLATVLLQQAAGQLDGDTLATVNQLLQAAPAAAEETR